MKKSIFWFRQDLRTFDNRWFIECIENSESVLPIFILDKNIVWDFWWLQDKKFWFLREALENLSKEIFKLSWIPLYIFYDFPENIIPFLVEKYNITSLYANTSYSNYGSKKRDIEIENILKQKNISFHLMADFLMVEPQDIPQRKVFTPFFKLWKQVPKDTLLLSPPSFSGIQINEIFQTKDFITEQKHPYFTLDFWKQRLENHIKDDYGEVRNHLDIDGTSKISPYLRFGIFSVRQIFKLVENNETFLSEIAWREFWQHINYYFPECKTLEFQENKRHISWEKNEFLFQRFCEWKTGYPIVDASIKQLLQTNRMHGRSRMIVASFLTKDLHIDWREWEKFFKKHLLDYDENINFWNWQWSASVWADPKPLRIFNPILQSQKFDPEAKFIKKYLPELHQEDLKAIHNPLEYELNYLKPIVDHRIEQKVAREMYKK